MAMSRAANYLNCAAWCSSTPSRAHDGAATGVCQLFLDAMSGKFDHPTDAWLRPEKRS